MNRDSSKILVVENLVKYYGEGENQVRAVAVPFEYVRILNH